MCTDEDISVRQKAVKLIKQVRPGAKAVGMEEQQEAAEDASDDERDEDGDFDVAESSDEENCSYDTGTRAQSAIDRYNQADGGSKTEMEGAVLSHYD